MVIPAGAKHAEGAVAVEVQYVVSHRGPDSLRDGPRPAPPSHQVEPCLWLILRRMGLPALVMYDPTSSEDAPVALSTEPPSSVTEAKAGKSKL